MTKSTNYRHSQCEPENQHGTFGVHFHMFILTSINYSVGTHKAMSEYQTIQIKLNRKQITSSLRTLDCRNFDGLSSLALRADTWIRRFTPTSLAAWAITLAPSQWASSNEKFLGEKFGIIEHVQDTSTVSESNQHLLNSGNYNDVYNYIRTLQLKIHL